MAHVCLLSLRIRFAYPKLKHEIHERRALPGGTRNIDISHWCILHTGEPIAHRRGITREGGCCNKCKWGDSTTCGVLWDVSEFEWSLPYQHSQKVDVLYLAKPWSCPSISNAPSLGISLLAEYPSQCLVGFESTSPFMRKPSRLPAHSSTFVIAFNGAQRDSWQA